MIGRTTCRKVCQFEAPWSRAASSKDLSKRLKTANMISRPKGRVHVSCAPKPAVAQWIFHPAWLKIRPTPSETRIEGITRLAMSR